MHWNVLGSFTTVCLYNSLNSAEWENFSFYVEFMRKIYTITEKKKISQTCLIQKIPFFSKTTKNWKNLFTKLFISIPTFKEKKMDHFTFKMIEFYE